MFKGFKEFLAQGNIVDLAVASYDDGVITVLLGKGDGTFPTTVKATASAGLFSVAADDFTGDGKPDLVVANRSTGRVLVLSNNSQ